MQHNRNYLQLTAIKLLRKIKEERLPHNKDYKKTNSTELSNLQLALQKATARPTINELKNERQNVNPLIKSKELFPYTIQF